MNELQTTDNGLNFNRELTNYVDSMQTTSMATSGKAWPYFYAAKQFLKYLDDTEHGVVDGFKAYIEDLRSQDLRARTFNHRLSSAKHLVKHLIDERRSEMCYADRAQLFETLDEQKPATLAAAMHEIGDDKYLDPDELQRFISGCSDMTIKLMAMFLAATGARISEMLRVKLIDIKCHRANCIIVLHGKGDKPRPVTISKKKVDLMRAHFHVSTWLFEHSGKQYSRRSVAGRFSQCGWKTIGRNVTPHMLRHSYASIMYKQTHDLVGVQRALGHASVSTTEKMYVQHSFSADERELKLSDDDMTVSELERALSADTVISELFTSK